MALDIGCHEAMHRMRNLATNASCVQVCIAEDHKQVIDKRKQRTELGRSEVLRTDLICMTPSLVFQVSVRVRVCQCRLSLFNNFKRATFTVLSLH